MRKLHPDSTYDIVQSGPVEVLLDNSYALI